jgi:hypothetical protein
LAQLRRVAPHFFLQTQRRIQSALQMVLVREWRAKQRENAIAGGLHDVTAVTSYGFDHQIQCRINNSACRLGVEVLH